MTVEAVESRIADKLVDTLKPPEGCRETLRVYVQLLVNTLDLPIDDRAALVDKFFADSKQPDDCLDWLTDFDEHRTPRGAVIRSTIERENLRRV